MTGVLIFSGALAMAFPQRGEASPPQLTRPAADGAKIYDRILPSAMWVLAGRMTGTATLVDRNSRWAVTNHHVVGDADTVEVLFPVVKSGKIIAERSHYLRNVKRIKAKVIGRDERRDLAILELERLPDDAPALPLAADSTSPGEEVHSVGNPAVSGALWVYTSGTVRQVYRRQFRLNDGRRLDARVVETQSPINSGDSGGPVVNAKGELVAVVQSFETRDARLVSTFIDVTEVRAVLDATRRAVAEASKPDSSRKGQTPHTAPTGPTARIARVEQEHNVERGGRKGLVLKIDFEIVSAKGVPGELVAVFHNRRREPIKARNREYANTAGELCAYQRLSPAYDKTVYRDMSLFIPYDEMPTTAGRNELRFLVNVWTDGRWIADNPQSGGFLITHAE